MRTADPAPDILSAIRVFLDSARQPAAFEPGADPIPLHPAAFTLSGSSTHPVLECWDSTHNLTRRIDAIAAQRNGRLELHTQRFGRRHGLLILADLAHPGHTQTARRVTRLHFAEQFRLALRRQYPAWRIVELSSGPGLEHSLSPAYPRALLRRGNQAIAAIGAPESSAEKPGPDPDGALTFGLIWLDHLRRREPRLSIGAVLVFIPIGSEINTCHRVRHLNPAGVQTAVFVHGHGMRVEEAVHPADYTNFATRVEAPRSLPCLTSSLTSKGRDLPEADLERHVRASITQLDGTLLPEPVYSQAPELASAHRGILDLLAIDFQGRLTVIELKATEDPHLPLQALDYWMRVRWHLERGDFQRAGYFPGIAVRAEAPRILLVAPAFAFHPTTETIIAFFAPEVEIELIGLGLEWRRASKVAFRACRAPL